MRVSLVPHTTHCPCIAAFPFFMVISCGSFISRFALHLTQYAISAISFFPFCLLLLQSQEISKMVLHCSLCTRKRRGERFMLMQEKPLALYLALEHQSSSAPFLTSTRRLVFLYEQIIQNGSVTVEKPWCTSSTLPLHSKVWYN